MRCLNSKFIEFWVVISNWGTEYLSFLRKTAIGIFTSSVSNTFKNTLEPSLTTKPISPLVIWAFSMSNWEFSPTLIPLSPELVISTSVILSLLSLTSRPSLKEFSIFKFSISPFEKSISRQSELQFSKLRLFNFYLPPSNWPTIYPINSRPSAITDSTKDLFKNNQQNVRTDCYINHSSK